MGLAIALHRRWTRDADPTVLDRCIKTARTAVDATPENHLLLPTWLAVLASAQNKRSSRRRRLDSVDEAIETYRRLLGLTPKDDPRRAARLLALADLLHVRFRLTADVSAGTEAVEAARHSVAHSEIGNGEQAERLVWLAALLSETHDGLDEAERIGRQALRDCPPDHPGRLTILSTFAQTLWWRYRCFGDPGELDEAITLLREAVAAITEPITHGVRLMILASALRARYARSPDLTTLNDAIAASLKAAEVLPAAHYQRTKVLANRVAVLNDHYQRTGQLASLTEAIETGERAVEATPDGHPNLGYRLPAWALR